MMKTFLPQPTIAIMMFCLLFAGGISFAQESDVPVSRVNSANLQKPTGKIGFVDVEIVIEQSRAIRMGMDALDKELSAIARKIDAKEREFRQKRFEMDRQERILSTTEREERRQELVRLQEETEQLEFDLEQQIRIRQRQIEPVLELIMNRVADVAEEQKFDMILRGEVVIYGRKAVDLTDDVITLLDSNVSEVLALFRDEQQNINSINTTQNSQQDNLPQEAKPAVIPIDDPVQSDDDDLLPLIP